MKKKLRPDFKERSFGISVGAVLLLIAAVLVWRGRITTAEVVGGVGAVLLVLGLTRPRLLKYPSAVWWKFAMILGYVNARVILTVAFAIGFCSASSTVPGSRSMNSSPPYRPTRSISRASSLRISASCFSTSSPAW